MELGHTTAGDVVRAGARRKLWDIGRVEKDPTLEKQEQLPVGVEGELQHPAAWDPTDGGSVRVGAEAEPWGRGQRGCRTGQRGVGRARHVVVF